MALIPPFFFDCVVAIGVPVPNASTSWIGTGFIAGRYDHEDSDGKRQYVLYVVTNKHVLVGKERIVLRLSSADHSHSIDYPISLISSNEPIWVGHPSADVDVAAFFVNPEVMKRDGAAISFFSLEEHAMGIGEMGAAEVSEGDAVFVLGFPMGIVSQHAMYAIARSGVMARIRDALNSQESAFLIDANIFPGNSGGPVVIRPEVSAIQGTQAINRAALVGIVKSYVPFQDVAVSQQTGRPRVIFEENSGLALVETVDSIRTTVDLCYQLRVEPGRTTQQ